MRRAGGWGRDFFVNLSAGPKFVLIAEAARKMAAFFHAVQRPSCTASEQQVVEDLLVEALKAEQEAFKEAPRRRLKVFQIRKMARELMRYGPIVMFSTAAYERAHVDTTSQQNHLNNRGGQHEMLAQLIAAGDLAQLRHFERQEAALEEAGLQRWSPAYRAKHFSMPQVCA